MPASDKSSNLSSNKRKPSGDGLLTKGSSKTQGKGREETKPQDGGGGDSGRRRGKRPRRSTQIAKYVYSDDDENENGDAATGSEASIKDTSDSDDFDDAIIEDEDDVGAGKPSKRRKRGKRASPIIVEGKEVFQCPHCGKTFKTYGGLQYHLDKLVCRAKDSTPKKGKLPPKKKARKNLERKKDLTCPHCNRVFKSMEGLKYHVEQKVCQKEPHNHDGNSKVRAFPTLKPGQKFVTQFGIVEVVKDDRAVPTAILPDDVQVKFRKYSKAKLLEDSKEVRRHARDASKLRIRRDAINAVYEKGKVNRRSIFEAYFDGDPEHIRSVINANKVLANGGTGTSPELSSSGTDSGKRLSDPKAPKDSFPDRIVECIMVTDNRSHFLNLTRNKVKRNAKQGSIRLFLQRRLLKQPYSKTDNVYHCPDCGRRFNSSQARKPHCEQKKCIQDAKIKKEKREAIQLKIERDLEDNRRFPKKRKFITNKEPTPELTIDGRPRKWKKRKKKKAQSSVYPEVIINMGFKLVTKQKNKTNIEQLKPLVPQKEKGRELDNILDDMKRALGFQKRKTSDQKHGSIYFEVYKALGFKKRRGNVITRKVVKQTRRRRETKPKPPPPLKPLPPAIDVGALVDEIKSGRYPSFKVFQGEHDDHCALCRKGGSLYCCEFCGNVEHFECILTKFTIKEPEPDEDFMCHKCIGIILSRRARAEKRRLRKQAKTEKIMKEHALALKDPTDGNEYPHLASQGKDVSELVELLKDSQVRLRRSIETTKLNNIRRQVIAGVYPDEYARPY